MTHPGTLHDGGKRTASIVVPPPSCPPSAVTPGQQDVLGLRVAAALIDLALLAGLFLIIASAAGLVPAAGGSFSIWLSSAWWAAFAAVAGLYYFVLETVSGQTAGKRLLGVQVCGPGRTRPSARAVAGRTLLRVMDFLPVRYLAGFVTIVAPGAGRRRIAGLAARGAVARAAPVRHRALAVVPLAAVLLAAAGLFGYPAGWQQHGGAASTPAGGTRELPAPGRAAAQASAERITSYGARIAIQRDGSILVTEQIVYNFGSDQRHGIFRVIPVRLRYNSTYDRIYAVDVQSVESPDAPAQYTVGNNGSDVSVKIGDPNQTVTGEHTYTLTYRVRGSLNAFADHDELYWNAVGNQWKVPIDQATVQVSAPADVTRAACFAGPPGSTAPCQHSGITSGVASFGQAGLGPNEGLTVVVATPKGAVASAGPVLQERWSLQRAFAVTPVSAGVAGGLLAVLAVLGAVVMARGRDRRYSRSAARVVGGTAVQAEEAVPLSGDGEPAMQSAPPADVRPGQAGTLLDGVANPRDVTGTIVDLAVRGYLRIDDAGQDTSRDWRLVRLDKTGGLLDYEQILLDGLFRDDTTVKTSPLLSDGLFRGDTIVKTSTLLSELGPEFTHYLKRAQDALYTDVAKRGWFTARPDTVRRKWAVIGCVLFVIGAVAVTVAAATSHLGLIPVPVALAGLVLIGCARWMPVRTAKGTDLARRLLGFRSYITTVAPRQALAAGQAPAGQHDVFEDYLPYAIVFGCTRQWADVTAALAGADRAPSWYRSGRPYSPSALTALSGSGYYFSSMHLFATTTSNWIASAASSGGGSSGFSGGGFSGGGGGGGGGGSW
jgi:uncharacterized membrane protein YgcG